MLMKKNLLAILMVASIVAICSATTSFASVTCYATTIVQAAAVQDDGDPTTAPYLIRATCQEPVWSGERVFDMSTDLGESGYATILTAMSLGKTVQMQLAGTGAWRSLIERIYLNQ